VLHVRLSPPQLDVDTRCPDRNECIEEPILAEYQDALSSNFHGGGGMAKLPITNENFGTSGLADHQERSKVRRTGATRHGDGQDTCHNRPECHNDRGDQHCAQHTHSACKGNRNWHPHCVR